MLRPSPNHGTQQLPNDDDDDGHNTNSNRALHSNKSDALVYLYRFIRTVVTFLPGIHRLWCQVGPAQDEITPQNVANGKMKRYELLEMCPRQVGLAVKSMFYP